MKQTRVFLLIPEGLTFDVLAKEQQEAIASVFGEFQEKMPGTITYNGQQVVDAIVTDNFDPSVMSEFGFNWPILGMWKKDENGMWPLVDFDETEWLNYLPNVFTYDEQGEVVEEIPPVFHIPHNWSGWPQVTKAG